MRLRFRQWLMESFGVDLPAFLMKALEDPHDGSVLLVAADWAEENGEPQLADYLRSNVGIAEMPEGEQRQAALTRLRLQVAPHVVRGTPPDGTSSGLFPYAVGDAGKKRRWGVEYRAVHGGVQKRTRRGGPWVPHDGPVPPEVAKNLLALMSRNWARPFGQMGEFYGGRTGRERMSRGLLQQANQRAYELHVSARDGFFAPTRELRQTRENFWRVWLEDAEDLVALVEQIARASHQAPGEDARSLAYFGGSLQGLIQGRERAAECPQAVAAAQALWPRYEAAMKGLGAPRNVPANAGEQW